MEELANNNSNATNTATFPNLQWSIYKGQDIICKDMKRQITDHISASTMSRYWQEKKRFNSEAFKTVD
jgi:hypothetical protein